MTPEEFRKLGHQLIDWLADYRSNISDYPVMSTVQPGDIRRALPVSPPETAQPFDDILSDLDEIIMPGISHWNHPSWFGYFPANASLASVLGDLMSSGLGVIGLNWQSSPALTELEETVLDWLRQMLGLSEAWQGVIQDTASTSSLVALISAREAAMQQLSNNAGLKSEGVPLVVYTSEQSHSSIEKAALLAGFGRENVRLIATDHHYAMRAVDLQQAIEDDLARGSKPCVVAATVGTTATTAVDPIKAIAELTQKHNIWLHVDTAMAGSAMILPECRWMWQGIEAADSLVLNPHKWLGVVFDCSVYYVRDATQLIRTMSTNPSYLQTAADGEVKNYRDWGIPLGRRFRSLKLWCLIREQGVSGIQARLRRDLANAQWLKQQLEAAAHWECLAPVVLQTLCLRHRPAGIEGDALNQHTLAWVERINRGGQAYLTPAKLDGQWMVRVSIGAMETSLSDVQQLWQLMQQTAKDVLSEG